MAIFFSLLIFFFMALYSSVRPFNVTHCHMKLFMNTLAFEFHNKFEGDENSLQKYNATLALDPIPHPKANYRIFSTDPELLRICALELLINCAPKPLPNSYSALLIDWQKVFKKYKRDCSPYGHYIFGERLPSSYEKSPIEYVVNCLLEDIFSKKACIPVGYCASMHFFVDDFNLSCVVSLPTINVCTEFPYQMAFCSFVHELVYKMILKKWVSVKLGALIMKANYVDIRFPSEEYCLKLLESSFDQKNAKKDYNDSMPSIDDPEKTLLDIYRGEFETDVMRWICNKAGYQP